MKGGWPRNLTEDFIRLRRKPRALPVEECVTPG
jgi:hypothetical protein